MSQSSNDPTTPARAVLYGRVSAVMGRGDDLTSPELQERVVRDYCERRGYDPVAWLCDLDLSGTQWSRRQVEHAVRMVEAGEAEVIVVPRWSRFTRSLRDYVVQTARIEAAGGRIESVLEDTDPATAAGLLQRDLFAILAVWESRLKGEQWKETHERRRRAGLPHDGRARLGYQLVDGHYAPHPVEGPIVASLYRRFLAGASMATLAEWLASKGVSSTREGKQWTGCGLQGFMRSGFAAGFLRVGDDYLPGAQKPLISKKMWERFCAERAVRFPKRPRLPTPATVLAGLVHCGNCRQQTRLRVRASTPERAREYAYLCEGRTCDNHIWVTRHILEAQIKVWLEQHAPAPIQTMTPTHRLQLERRLVQIDAGMVKNRTDHAMGDYGVAMRDRVEASLKERRTEAQRRINQADGTDTSADAALEVATHWDQWPPERLNEALLLVIKRIDVLRLPGRRQRSISVDAA